MQHNRIVATPRLLAKWLLPSCLCGHILNYRISSEQPSEFWANVCRIQPLQYCPVLAGPPLVVADYGEVCRIGAGVRSFSYKLELVNEELGLLLADRDPSVGSADVSYLRLISGVRRTSRRTRHVAPVESAATWR